MRGCDAIKNRILELAKNKNLSINKICTLGGLTTSTVNTMLNGASEYPSTRTIQKICQGLGITVFDFYNHDSFKNLEPED